MLIVEPAPGVDLEGLDVVKDCLEEVFKVNTSSSNDGIQPGLLADLFSSEVAKSRGLELDSVPEAIECTPCTSSSSHQSMVYTDMAISNICSFFLSMKVYLFFFLILFLQVYC